MRVWSDIWHNRWTRHLWFPFTCNPWFALSNLSWDVSDSVRKRNVAWVWSSIQRTLRQCWLCESELIKDCGGCLCMVTPESSFLQWQQIYEESCRFYLTYSSRNALFSFSSNACKGLLVEKTKTCRAKLEKNGLSLRRTLNLHRKCLWLRAVTWEVRDLHW